MRIALMCFGIASIASVSGMEKVYVEMANEFVRRGHIVYAVCNDAPGVKPYYRLDERVRYLNLGLGKIKPPFRYKALREVSKALRIDSVNQVDLYRTKILLAEIIKRLPEIDVTVCYEFNSVMVANALKKYYAEAKRKKLPVAVMVHNSVEDQIARLTFLQRKEASKADVYQVLMPGYVERAKKLLSCRVIYIPNVVPGVSPEERAHPETEKKRRTILHIGRVEGRQKRQLILVKAFSRLAEKFSDWDVGYFGPVGDFRYKQEIDDFVREHNLQSRVLYKGITDTPLKELARGDIFAFPSAYEGFSLAMTEAMSVGLPIVAFKNIPGVSELLGGERSGALLAEDENGFAQALKRLMLDASLRKRLSLDALQNVRKYSPEIVWQQWEDLLVDLVRS